MSDPYPPTDPSSAPGVAPEPSATVPPTPQPHTLHVPQNAAGDGQAGGARGLSTFLKVSIVLLAALTLASIALLFIGDFEGKFERVFSTFVLFAVFVVFTALDTRRGQKSEWYAPVALIANAYILALLLVVIWMTRYYAFTLIWGIFWKSVFVILVTRLVILCCQVLLQMSGRLPEVVLRFAFATSVLAVLTGILFTAPVGVELFDLYIPDLYWRISTALLILTALGLSITLLLKWSYGAEAREAARARARAHLPATGVPGQQLPAPGQGIQGQVIPGQVVQDQPPLAQPVQGQPPLLPWPTFPDGRPFPMGPDGQPDFSAAQR